MHGVYDTAMPRDGPTAAGSVARLLECLEGLRAAFKAAVARLVGGSAARAVHGWVRALFGLPAHEDGDEDEGGYGAREAEYGGTRRGRREGREGGAWGRWDEDDEDEDVFEGAGAKTPAPWAAPAWVPSWLAWALGALAPLAAWLLPLAA